MPLILCWDFLDWMMIYLDFRFSEKQKNVCKFVYVNGALTEYCSTLKFLKLNRNGFSSTGYCYFIFGEYNDIEETFSVE